MAEDPSTPSETAKDATAGSADETGSPGSPPSVESLPPGAPIPPDAIDPELLRLPVRRAPRHPGIAVAVLLIGALLLYRMRADVRYALQPGEPAELGAAAEARNKLAEHEGGFVRIAGLPDHKNALAFDPKGGRARSQIFRILGTGSRVFVTSLVERPAPYENRFTGRLRRFDDLHFADTVRGAWQQTQALRAIDLGKLRALPTGALPAPLSTLDRAGEPLSVADTQELLIDVLFPDDVRLLLSKEKFPSEPDARHEVERLGPLVAHGPGIETRDGFGYVLRLPPPGPDRQRLLAQIDAMGIWLWHRVESYRVPLRALQNTPAGLMLPGPDALPQPVRYQPSVLPTPAPVPAPAAPPAGTPAPPAASPPPASTEPRLLVAEKDQNTLILWEHVQSVQVTEPLGVPADAWVVIDGETPRSQLFMLPLGALLVLFMAFNVWYLLRSLRKGEPETA